MSLPIQVRESASLTDKVNFPCALNSEYNLISIETETEVSYLAPSTPHPKLKGSQDRSQIIASYNS